MIQNVSVPAALIAGLVSFLSPCVLPLVPPYLIYLTGATIEHVANEETAAASRRRAVMISALLSVLGFSTVFLLLGASASLIGSFIRAWSAQLAILAAILSIAAAEATVTKGAGLLAIYSAGLGIPFLIAAFMVEQFSSLFSRMKRHLATVERAMGVLMIITGVGFLTGAVSNVSIWLLDTFPSLQSFG